MNYSTVYAVMDPCPKKCYCLSDAKVSSKFLLTLLALKGLPIPSKL